MPDGNPRLGMRVAFSPDFYHQIDSTKRVDRHHHGKNEINARSANQVHGRA
jgi:hypothetical protein